MLLFEFCPFGSLLLQYVRELYGRITALHENGVNDDNSDASSASHTLLRWKSSDQIISDLPIKEEIEEMLEEIIRQHDDKCSKEAPISSKQIIQVKS